mmetsp:Transcript_27290/g.77464  ORF Transcript_27290/g.77464 Transcript_27290/m.77464 type:complete len:306 (+) Transcript_27290:521-1438(+)
MGTRIPGSRERLRERQQRRLLGRLVHVPRWAALQRGRQERLVQRRPGEPRVRGRPARRVREALRPHQDGHEGDVRRGHVAAHRRPTLAGGRCGINSALPGPGVLARRRRRRRMRGLCSLGEDGALWRPLRQVLRELRPRLHRRGGGGGEQLRGLRGQGVRRGHRRHLGHALHMQGASRGEAAAPTGACDVPHAVFLAESEGWRRMRCLHGLGADGALWRALRQVLRELRPLLHRGGGGGGGQLRREGGQGVRRGHRRHLGHVVHLPAGWGCGAAHAAAGRWAAHGDAADLRLAAHLAESEGRHHV